MSEIYDLVIIGSGPAGLSAAIYAERARLKTVVIEQSYISGGQVVTTYEVDNYAGLPGISGMDMATKFREHAVKMGAEFFQATVMEIKCEGDLKTVITNKNTIKAKTVLIATGARHRKLHAAGEEELAGMGVSYCATCDGAFFKELDVAVIGGGDVAVEDAIFLARGCKKVYLIHRRDELRAAKVLQERLFALDNVEVIWDSVVERIQGVAEVEGVLIKNVKEGTSKEISVQGVFIAVGILPNTDTFKELVDMDEGNYIIAEENGVTSESGVFVAGDVRTKDLRQIITAASDGANAVTSVQKYLIEHP